MWWGRYAKRMMRQIFIQEGTSRRRDRQTLGNFYYEAIYTAQQEDNLRDMTLLTLKQVKAKIVGMYHETHHQLFLDNDDQNKMEDEEPSLHHLLKRHNRQQSRMVKL
jgi:alkaline phosphatase